MAMHPTHKDDDDKAAPARVSGAAATPKVATPRDTAADQTRLLLLLAGDWVNNDRTHAREIAVLVTSLTAAAGPPVNVDVPHVSQTGATLNCTMGNWNGEPTDYAYAWQADGVANEATGPTYTVKPEDAGHSLACVVTATNAMGSTTAPMSNAIAIPAV
jgi:hypothetical protein